MGETDLGTESNQLGKASPKVDSSTRTENLATLTPEKLTIDFPGKVSLGELYILDEEGKARFHSDALGSVQIPEGVRLVLYCNFDPAHGIGGLADLSPTALHSISFMGSEISNGDLLHLGRLAGLREMDASCTQIGDAGLSHLKELRHLSKLNLASTKISSYGLSWIADGTKLRELVVDNCEIGDEALAQIASFTSLNILSLSFTEISDRGLSQLKGLTTLQKLRLNCTKISDDGLIYLTRLVNLKELWVRSTRVSYPGLIELTKWLPDCEIII